MSDSESSVRQVEMTAMGAAGQERRRDDVAIEEPLEIRVVEAAHPERRHSVSVTMRTPGHDFELAAGFLFSEGILPHPGSIQGMEHCGVRSQIEQQNVLNVRLAPQVRFDPARYTRNVYTTSSCGICGKTSIEMVRVEAGAGPLGEIRLNRDFFFWLPDQLSASQPLFARTGGLHAAALFDESGELLLVREDVGRHNALDKVVGRLLLDGRLPASEAVLVLSGRASFELVQKAVLAGIPVVASVGAPSSLAIELASEFGVTLIGFLRQDRFNVYTGAERLAGPVPDRS